MSLEDFIMREIDTRPSKATKTWAKKCVTHSYSCNCREYQRHKMVRALKDFDEMLLYIENLTDGLNSEIRRLRKEWDKDFKEL